MTDVLNTFIDKKKADSVFVTLLDGESIDVKKLTEIKIVEKTGFGGDEKEVLRLIVEVETSEGLRTKNFDNGTQRFATEIQEKGIQIGSSFTITRHGEQTKTRYEVSNVKNPTAPKKA